MNESNSRKRPRISGNTDSRFCRSSSRGPGRSRCHSFVSKETQSRHKLCCELQEVVSNYAINVLSVLWRLTHQEWEKFTLSILLASTFRQCVLEHTVVENSPSTPPARRWPRPLRPPPGRLFSLLFHFHVESPTQTQSKQETELLCFHWRVKTESEVCCFVKFLGFTGVWDIRFNLENAIIGEK